MALFCQYHQNVFRPYDIRGVYPTDLNEKTAYAVGQALIDFLPKNNRPIIVARDMRLSSARLKNFLIKGILSRGVDVIDLGLAPIDALYFAVIHLKGRGGAMVTASHNPKNYNGFKMFDNNLHWVGGQQFCPTIEKYPIKLNPPASRHGGPASPARQGGPADGKLGQTKSFDIMPAYFKHLFSFVDLKKINPPPPIRADGGRTLKVVIDAGNGLAGQVIPQLQKKLPIKIISLFAKLDGSFPNHPSDPFLPKSTVVLKKRVIKEKADFGVIFDGDADRLAMVDGKGNFFTSDVALLIIAKHLLKKEPGGLVVYNIGCSQAVPEKIKSWGGKPLLSRTGYGFIRELMRKNRAIFGGEVSGHFLFRENYYADSGFIAFLTLLEALSAETRPLSAIAAELLPYHKTEEINFSVKNQGLVFDKIEKYFKGKKINYLDGLTINFNDWWFNLRPSNTEPKIRLIIEAKTKSQMLAKRKAMTQLIKKFSR
ncbi:MAG: phosphomannomutase/phosphoglucomutase [bacterium]